MPPADLAFSLPFCPIPPTPFPVGKGEIFGFLMQGAPPLAFPGLNPGGTGYFLPCQCFSAPIPPTRARRALFPAGKGEIFGFLMQGAPPLASSGLNLGGTGFFCCISAFLPPSPRPPSQREGGDFWFILPGAGAPGTPATEPGRRWFAGASPLHPRG